MCNTSFYGIVTGIYIYGIILVIGGHHHQNQKVKIMTASSFTKYMVRFWLDNYSWHYFGYTKAGPKSKDIKSKGKKYYFFTKAISNKQMFDGILIGESMSLITLMIKGHLQV